MTRQNYLQKLDLSFFERIYQGSIYQGGQRVTPLFSAVSPYQHIFVVESSEFGRQLYLNGSIQVSEADSEKYHEYLMIPAIAAHPNPKRILIVGEGDGGGLYQALRYPFQVIHHVELDQEVIHASRQYLNAIHHGALDHPRVTRYIEDGRQFLSAAPQGYYDIIVLAFPDPYALKIATLYTKEFFTLAKNALSETGVLVMQTSDIHAAPGDRFYVAAQACILQTLRSVFSFVFAYRVDIPSFWTGNTFMIAGKSQDPRIIRNHKSIKGKWCNSEEMKIMFSLTVDIEDYLRSNKIFLNTQTNPMLHIYMHPAR